MATTQASLSISDPNERWIQHQIECGEFSSRSEVVNDALRKARAQIARDEAIRAKLVVAEGTLEREGFIDKTPQQILEGFKQRAFLSGEL